MQARLTVRADAGAISQVEAFVAAFAARHGLSADDRLRVCVVLEELITNLVKYGYPGRSEPGAAEVALGLEGARLTIELSDDGQAFDPFAPPAPELDRPLEARPVGGLGLYLVRALTDEACYTRRDDRNIVRLTRYVTLLNQS
jgi:serine/threonine-protein kinase RsbW